MCNLYKICCRLQVACLALDSLFFFALTSNYMLLPTHFKMVQSMNMTLVNDTSPEVLQTTIRAHTTCSSVHAKVSGLNSIDIFQGTKGRFKLMIFLGLCVRRALGVFVRFCYAASRTRSAARGLKNVAPIMPGAPFSPKIRHGGARRLLLVLVGLVVHYHPLSTCVEEC
jgi:hypothetical protein